jgi:nucleoside-diphosphate-sugar epimerase
MSVTAIRPHLVWGPGDTQLVGRIVDRARRGRLAYVGTGAALIDSTYVDNAVDSLVAAIDRGEHAGGHALVVSNGEPWPIADLVGGIVAAHGLRPPARRVPKRVAFAAGWIAEQAWTRLPLSGEPPLTSGLLSASFDGNRR